MKGEIHIFIDLRKLNDSYVHDPFPKPFTDEVLENAGGKNPICLLMGSQCIIRSILHQRIGVRPPSQLNGVVFSIQFCLSSLKMPLQSSLGW